MATGCPVVSTDCPSGPREILKDGKYGPLVPVGDAEALADGIQNVLTNPPSMKEIKESTNRFTEQKATVQYTRELLT
jgi:glycosyltransferase involved in cell wall biosynthesis